VLWRDYKESLRWLLRCRWVVALLALCVVVGQADRILVSSIVRDAPWWHYLVPRLAGSSQWAERLISQFVHGWIYTYFIAPMMRIRPIVAPVKGGTSLAILALLAGLWVFRRHIARAQILEELQPGIESFKRTLNWTTVLAGFGLVGMALCLIFGEDVRTLLRTLLVSGPPDRVAYWIYLPPSVLVGITCATLLVSALLGSFRTHLDGASPDKPFLAAFRYYRPLFTLYICVTLVAVVLGTGHYMLSMLEETRFRAYFLGPFYHTVAGRYSIPGLIELIYLTFLLVPAAIVAEDISLKAAIKRNFSVWCTRPMQMIVVVAFFMAVAFVVGTALQLVYAPVSPVWIVTAVIGSFVGLLLRTSILLAVYRFYVRISEDDASRATVSDKLVIAGNDRASSVAISGVL